jgi:DNA recombination protein RmuC
MKLPMVVKQPWARIYNPFGVNKKFSGKQLNMYTLITVIIILFLAGFILLWQLQQKMFEKTLKELGEIKLQQEQRLNEFKEYIAQSLQKSVFQYTGELTKRVEKLTDDTNQRLKEISGQVEKRLAEGFEKTTATFADVVKRLALIDEAQKKITELSTNVVSLQEILSDKKSRGAFGEVQLSGLIRNMLPTSHFSFQHTLSNGKRVDCMLFLPDPTGNVAIDAKFPLESYQQMMDDTCSDKYKLNAKKQFKQLIQKHIRDISSKYIIPGETSDGAVMFIPAEAVFAEIHAHFPDLVAIAQKERVWMVSPTTMMAILTTARAVLKDEATRKQVHIIRDHLSMLAKDFARFQNRMDNLAKHVKQAHDDVEQVHSSAKKITSRFTKIEQVELKTDDSELKIAKQTDEI